MNSWRILIGDVREQLSTLPNGCVRTCVTSPPYWGLRDYGTATWEGGDSNCEHVGQQGRTVSGGQGKQYTNAGSRVYSGDCACGARRIDNQLGLESTPEAYVASMVAVFAEVRRVLADDGTVWLNLGDSYTANGGGGESRMIEVGRPSPNAMHAHRGKGQLSGRTGSSRTGLKAKDLVGIPWMVAFALRADGWYLRSDIIWSKPNPMPESITDRPTSAHEHMFLLAKSQRYYYDADAIAEPLSKASMARYTAAVVNKEVYDPARHKTGASAHMRSPMQVLTESAASVIERGTRNKRNVWTIPTNPYPDAHFATFPEDLIEPCILAGSAHGDTVLDPFTGSGTTGAVAIRHQRNFVGCELNPAYVQLARKRIGDIAPMFATEDHSALEPAS